MMMMILFLLLLRRRQFYFLRAVSAGHSIITTTTTALDFRYFSSILTMIRKSSKVHPSLSEDNNDQSLSSHQSENQLRPSENLNTSTEQVKLKKLRNFSKKLFLHYII